MRYHINLQTTFLRTLFNNTCCEFDHNRHKIVFIATVKAFWMFALSFNATDRLTLADDQFADVNVNN